MKPLALFLIAFSFTPILDWLKRDTNSHAASARGVKEFGQKKYPQSVKDFSDAARLRPSPRNSFNLGTAEIAAGKREEGSHALDGAMNDPDLRASALFNRGNGALSVKQYDYAVRDYIDALRAHPADADVKRNLEIALAKQEQEQKKQQQDQGPGGGGGNEQKKQQQQQGEQQKENPQQQQSSKPQSQPTQPDQQQQQGSAHDQQKDKSAEDLLRAIQQQESEELQRMKRARAQGKKVGW